MLLYPFYCMPSVVAPMPMSTPFRREKKSSDAFKINTARIRKRGEQGNDGSGLLFVSLQISVHRRIRDLGKLVGGSHRKVLYGSNGGGAQAIHGGAAKSLLDLRCGMVNGAPQIILCRHRADLPVTAGVGRVAAKLLTQVLGIAWASPSRPFASPAQLALLALLNLDRARVHLSLFFLRLNSKVTWTSGGWIRESQCRSCPTCPHPTRTLAPPENPPL